MNRKLRELKNDVQFSCPACSFSLWIPLATMSVSVLGLYDDARFPGRCILALNEHREDFSLLEKPLASEFFADCQRAARAIKAAVHV
jgi:hypothetical protein